jgi:hypothetical protein
MSVKELIQHAVQKDASSFEAQFNDIMADRMTAAIETKYAAMFSPSETESQLETEE